MSKKILLMGLLASICFSNICFSNNCLAGEVIFTDALDREVTVCDPERVAVLIGSFADVWCLAGGEVCATVDDAWDEFALDISEDAVNLGNTKEPSVEKLLASEPDFIIASSNTRADMDMLDTLNASGITTAYFYVNNFEDYLNMLKICTDITGREDLYEKNGLEIKNQIETVIEDSKERLETEEAPKVLVMRFSSTAFRAVNSQGNVMAEMLSDLGCINIADANDTLLENLNIEYILQEDPDYIFAVQSGNDVEGSEKALDELLEQNAAWAALTAVRERNVYRMDKRLYNMKPNALWGEAYEGLEKILSDKQE